MRTRSSWIWCWIVGVVLASGAGAQQYTTIIDNLPTCTGNRNGRVISVSDATSDSDCTVGGATGEDRFVHQCICDTLNALGPYWKAVGGGAGGAGVSGLDTADGGTALADNTIVRGDGTTGIQGSAVTIADTTGDLQWEGTTADDFEGNFTFADPTEDWTWAWGATGSVTIPGNIQGPTAGFTIFGGTSATADLIFQTTTGVGASGSNMSFLVGNNGALEALRLMYDGQAVFRTINIGSSNATETDAKIAIDQGKFYIGSGVKMSWGSATTPVGYAFAPDTEIGREAADVVKLDSMLELTPVASGGTCDAGNAGRIYSDTSPALCWCDGTTAQKLSGAGTCD